LRKKCTFSRLGAGGFKGGKMGLHFKIGMFVKALGVLGPSMISWVWGL
jgi:hypothetical protein